MKSKITMKTILILALALGIQFSTLVASNIGDAVTPNEPSVLACPECPVLSPKVPLEAPFMEFTEFDFTMNLFPVVPMEADFDDDVVLPISQKKNFTPVVPTTADFNDAF